MNVAMIGCSGMGRVHAAMAARAGANIVVCADLNRDAAKTLAEEHGADVLTDGMAAIGRSDVDVVCIATPTPTHLSYILAAAKAGKHIFCEKPFCRTSSQCKEAIEAARKAGVKLFVGHVVRYFNDFEALRQQVESGVIGHPGWAKLYRGGIFPGGPDSWFANYEQSGGVTFDCMIHDLDWVRYVFGEPDHIFCQALMRSAPEPLDYSQVTLRLKNGFLATVIGTWAAPSGFRVKVEICGNKGMLQLDSNEAPIQALKREKTSGPSMIVPSSPLEKSPYQLEWEDFIAWLEEGRTPKVTAQDALIAVRMAEAALQSAQTGKPVKC